MQDDKGALLERQRKAEEARKVVFPAEMAAESVNITLKRWGLPRARRRALVQKFKRERGLSVLIPREVEV